MTSAETGIPQEIIPDPRYPVGRWQRTEAVTPQMREEALRTLGELPDDLRHAVAHLHADQLATPYRDGGWTVQQVVHHVADSHSNMYHRVRFALTEREPTIKVYDEKLWAELHDSVAAPVEWSLALLEALHARLLMLLRSLSEEQWQRRFVHPVNGPMSLDTTAQLYAWHSRHHVAHITHLRKARGW